MGGLEVLKSMKDRQLATRVVVLSMHAKETYVAEALGSGALAYVVKDASASDVLQAVRSAAEGRRFLSPPLSEAAIDAFRQRNGSPGDDTPLTTRERQVLKLAAQGRTNQQIADELNISRRTAETHRANLMRKLGLKGQQELIRYALRHGLVEL
jgi:DNA-binding NarL/FixJ family response regulator